MNTALRAHGIAKQFAGARVLGGVDLSVRAGEAGALLGAPASGKSTLLSILAGLLAPDAGEWWVGHGWVRCATPEEHADLRRTRLGLVWPGASPPPGLSVEAGLTLVAENAGLPRVHACGRVTEVLARLDLEELAARRPEQLDAGQRDAVAVARALLHRPAVLLVDALAGGYDPRLTERLIAAAHETRLAVLMVVPDWTQAAAFDRTFELADGCAVERTGDYGVRSTARTGEPSAPRSFSGSAISS